MIFYDNIYILVRVIEKVSSLIEMLEAGVILLR